MSRIKKNNNTTTPKNGNKKENGNGNDNGNNHHEDDPKLTTKQELFVTEYLIDFNATQAAIRAGYKKDNADRVAYENLRKVYIGTAIRRKVEELLDDRTPLAAKTLRNLEVLGDSNITNFVVIGKNGKQSYVKDLNDVDTRAIKSLEVTEDIKQEIKRKANKKTKREKDVIVKEKVIERKIKIALWDKPRSLDTLSKVTKLMPNEFDINANIYMKIDPATIKEKMLEKLLRKAVKKKESKNE